MANLTLSETSYTVVGKTITVNYTTDVRLTNIKLSKDNINFIEPISFSQVSALFDISTWNNGEYTNCILRGYYGDNGIMVDKESVALNEDSSATFSVYLKKSPEKDTVINLECDDTNNARIDKTSLTFNSDNYNVPQMVTVTGIYNADDVDKIVNITLSNTDLGNKTVIATIKNINNCYGEIVLSNTNLSVNENSSTTFTVKLNSRPTNNQIVTLSRENENISMSVDNLTFTRSNYDTPQTVTITGTYDESSSNKTCNITLSSPNVGNATVGVTVTNIDSYGEIITASAETSNIEVYPTTQGTVSSSGGGIISSRFQITTDYVDISSFRDTRGVNITLNISGLEFASYALYDKNKVFTVGKNPSGNNFTIPLDYLSIATYIRISIKDVYGNPISPSSNYKITFTPLS